jgi:RHS repeat-associated protein
VTNVAEKIFSDFNFAYAFDTNQLPISRSTPWANVTYSGNFDLCGRPLGLTRKEGSAYSSPLTLLSENLTWNADNRMASYGVVRGGSGAGNYSDARAYTYDGDGRLANETFAANATANAASVYAFDANNLGVRITANSTATVSNTTSALNSWAVANGGLDGLGQTLLEERGGETLTANGTTNGRGVDSPAIRLTLTSNTSPVAAALGNIAFNATTGNWTAPLLLGPGNYTLTATAAHPSGQYNATAVSNFTLNATSPYAAAQTENLFDGDGYISGRVSGNGTAAVSTDTNTWDGAGRLLKIARRNASNNGFDEAAVYDPFGRRVRDVYSPVTSGNETGNETTDSWFDPAVAYLEVAANQTGNLSWKVYGPDAGGAFGGMQGLGALEAVLVPGNNTASGVWNDSLGHVVAYSAPANVSGAPSAPVWNVYSSGYGPLPGQTALRWSQTVTANVTTNVFAATLSWQGRRIDASGYFWLGARIYDPTGGKFLAPDPLGQAASWDLYSYAAGDPINRADPTGAVSSDLYSKIENLSADQIQMQMSELDINGEIPTYGQWFVGQAVEGLGEGAVILGQAALMLTGVGELEAPVLAEEAGLAAEEGAVGTEVLAGEGFAEAGEAGIEQAAGGEIAAEGGGEIAGGGGGGQMEFGFAAETTGQAPAAAAPGGQMEFSFAQEAESAAPAAEAEAPGQSYLNFGGGGSASPGLTQGELNLPAEAAESGGSTALSTLRQTTDGESFFHYGYGEQASGYAGGLKPGGYVTSAGDLTGAEARSGLALPGGRPLPNSVYQVTPEPGTWIRVNPVTSPQFGQPGGLPEFQFPYGTGPGTVGSPTPLP